MEELSSYLNEIRRDFTAQRLDRSSVERSPFLQFAKWFEEAVGSQLIDNNAFTLSTSDKKGHISSRILLLRDAREDGFVFYTNYNSHKGRQMADNPNVALNFFWAPLERQVRIEGVVEKLSSDESDQYFASRPRASQIGAWASDQSETIKNRVFLEQRVKDLEEQFKDKEVPRPPHWGGYIVKPSLVEFWQGRPGRLHDRIVYHKEGDTWRLERLSP